MEDELRNILRLHGGLSVPADGLDDEADLFAAGLSSLATVNVMLAIEQQFDIVIPDDLLTRRTFRTIASLAAVVKDQSKGTTSA